MSSVSHEPGSGEFSGNTPVGFTLESVIFSIKAEMLFVPGRVTQLGSDSITS